MSTGRFCEGYGVWGGGTSHRFAELTRVPMTTRALRDLSSLRCMGLTSGIEQITFDWFRHRARFKLSGVFSSRFWDSQVLQACSTHPAVLHAVLALGSAHKLEMQIPLSNSADLCARSRQQQKRFTLQQYNKAIACVQPLLSRTQPDIQSSRVVLIACMVFVCLELLQGRYIEGIKHLCSGMVLLNQLQDTLRTSLSTGTLSHAQDTIDDRYLIEAFSSLYYQSFILGQTWGVTKTAFVMIDERITKGPPPTFSSISEAKLHLHSLYADIDRLKTYYNHTDHRQKTPRALSARQRDIQRRLSLWEQSYRISRIALSSQLSARESLCYPLLRIHLTVANILAATCLSPEQCIFDHFMPTFDSILRQCEDVLDIAAPLINSDLAAGFCSGRFSFTTDMGLIPPLYFTALKCRSPTIRRKAIRLLDAGAHKEGVWNGHIAIRVAQQVITLEETGIRNKPVLDCRLSDLTVPNAMSSSLPGMESGGLSIPELQRIHAVDADLTNYQSGIISLRCTRRSQDGEWEDISIPITIEEDRSIG